MGTPTHGHFKSTVGLNMQIVVTTDNEVEIWSMNKKIGYVDNNALWAIHNDVATYVGEVTNRSDILPALRDWFKRQ